MVDWYRLCLSYQSEGHEGCQPDIGAATFWMKTYLKTSGFIFLDFLNFVIFMS